MAARRQKQRKKIQNQSKARSPKAPGPSAIFTPETSADAQKQVSSVKVIAAPLNAPAIAPALNDEDSLPYPRSDISPQKPISAPVSIAPVVGAKPAKATEAKPDKPVVETKIAEQESLADDRSKKVEVTSERIDKGSVVYGVNSFDGGLHIEATTDLQSIVVEPGKSFALGFRITNLSGRAGTFIEEFVMPDGFQLTFPPAEFNLEPMESYNSIVMVTASKFLSAGEHRFTYNVFERNDQSVHGSLSFSFNISEMIDLRFVIEEKPNSIIDGESFTIKGKLFNNSNRALTVGLDMTQQKHFRVNFGPKKTVMKPGSFANVVIKGRTGINNRRGTSLTTVLTARDLGRKDRRVLLNQAISIGFYAKAKQRIDFKNRLPVVVTARVKSRENEYSTQMEVSSRGYIDNKNQRQIDFLVREKGSKDSPGLTLSRDEARFKYEDQKVRLFVGDGRYGVSRLSKSYLGRGISADYNFDGLTRVGFVDYESRWSSVPLEGKGVYVARQFNRKINLKLSHFVTTGERFDISPEERFTTLSLNFRPNRGSSLKAEISKKWGGELADKKDAAFSVDYITRVRDFATFSIHHSDTGVIYAGNTIGNENTTTSVNVPISDRLKGSVSYSKDRQNPLLKTTGISASEIDRFTSGLVYDVNDKNTLRLSYSDRSSVDWLNKKFDEREKYLEASISHKGQSFGSNYSLYRRRILDRLSGKERMLTDHRLQGYFRMRDDLTLGGFAGVSRNSGYAGYYMDDSDIYGISLNWRILESFAANMSFRETLYKGKSGNYQNLNLNLLYKLEDSQIDFKVIRNAYSNIPSTQPLYYELSVSREFGIPVGKNTKIGALTGFVKEKVGSGTRPLANVTLLMKQMAAVTDAKGKFVFADVSPGTYTLDIDRRYGAINKIAQNGLPVTVSIAGGKLAVLNLVLEDACQLTGEVRVVDSKIPEGILVAPMPDGFKKIESEKLSGLVIEVRSDSKRYLATSDSAGKFVFYGLKAGKWKYRVLDTSIPTGYQIDQPAGMLEIEPDGENYLGLKVSQQIREIEMVDAE